MLYTWFTSHKPEQLTKNECVKCSSPHACTQTAAALGTLYKVQPTLAEQEGEYTKISLI